MVYNRLSTIMKKSILIVLAMIIATVSFAQQLNVTQFATLSHNDTVTAYYGSGALAAAHEMAAHGDIITLSPGWFEATAITKAVTIRGAGMLNDTVANRYNSTQIGNSFMINIPNVAGYHLTFEGVYISDVIVYVSAYNPQFKKCRIGTIRKSASGQMVLFQPFFSNCIVGAWDGSSSITNAMFVNSIVLNSWQGEGHGVNTNGYGGISEYYYWGYDLYTCGQSYDVYYNCIVNISPNIISNKRNIVNCITYSYDTNAAAAVGTNVYNTLGILEQGSFYGTNSHDNTNINSFENIFKTFRGTYTEGETFELTDQAAANYLGSDNTQIGIYGGSAVFNPKATDMRIRKYSVGFYSDGNGQLKITTELENQ